MFKNADQYLRNVSVDNVILGYHDKELKILLQQPFVVNKWTVTGGYIKKTESIEEAAHRIAYLRTGLKGLYLQQFRSFGNPKRVIDSGFTAKHIREITGQAISPDSWIFDYFVSVGFYTLTEFSQVEFKKGLHEQDCRWWPVFHLPPMMFDHKHIISEALAPCGFILRITRSGMNCFPKNSHCRRFMRFMKPFWENHWMTGTLPNV